MNEKMGLILFEIQNIYTNRLKMISNRNIVQRLSQIKKIRISFNYTHKRSTKPETFFVFDLILRTKSWVLRYLNMLKCVYQK